MIMNSYFLIGRSLFFLSNYIMIRLGTSYGEIGPIAFIPAILIVSLNSAWYLSSLVPIFSNKIIAFIVYLFIFIIYNFWGIFIFISDN